MNDDFLNSLRKEPRAEFAAALRARISNPMQTESRRNSLLSAAVSLAAFGILAAALAFSPSARAFADSILRQFGVGGYIFVQGTAEPTVSPEEQATARAFGKPMLQPANDAAAASQLAGFTVLAPSYLPAGYTADNQPAEWTVSDEINGMTARIDYHSQAGDDHLMIQELMVRPGQPNTVLDRPEIQQLTVRGQPGAWMPTGGGKNLLAWEENGITYMIVSNTLPNDEVLKIADSLGK